MADNKCVNIGGQAVIEGIMMRAPGNLAIAVRTPEGEIVVRKQKISLDGIKFFKLPFFRGMVGLYDAMVLGVKALNFSSIYSGLEDENKPSSKISTYFSLLLGLGLGVLLFVFLPLFLTSLLRQRVAAVENSFFVFNLVDGIIRMLLFLVYIFLTSLSKDIQRVFQYHGAEHKSIYAYEKGLDLTVDNARKMSRLHPRCGTSFLLIVMFVAIVVFSLIPKDSHFAIKFASRVVFLPLIAGISYEILRLSSKYSNHILVKILILPGLALQKITTREPDDSQLEVAIVSIKAALSENDKEEGFKYV